MSPDCVNFLLSKWILRDIMRSLNDIFLLSIFFAVNPILYGGSVGSWIKVLTVYELLWNFSLLLNCLLGLHKSWINHKINFWDFPFLVVYHLVSKVSNITWVRTSFLGLKWLLNLQVTLYSSNEVVDLEDYDQLFFRISLFKELALGKHWLVLKDVTLLKLNDNNLPKRDKGYDKTFHQEGTECWGWLPSLE